MEIMGPTKARALFYYRGERGSWNHESPRVTTAKAKKARESGVGKILTIMADHIPGKKLNTELFTVMDHLEGTDFIRFNYIVCDLGTAEAAVDMLEKRGYTVTDWVAD